MAAARRNYNFAHIGETKKYLVVIAGPTAIGKTSLAIEVAKHFKTEIISADSRQFYRELNIGTAKPGEQQLREVPHHFINNRSADELYGSGHFAKEALELMSRLFMQHDVLVITGGSGLYIDAVLNGVDDFPEVPLSLRESLNEVYRQKGNEWLREELKLRDPAYFASADTDNPQRMLRALEVCIHTGRPYSGYLSGRRAPAIFTPIKILLNTKREILYERINRRVDDMMAQGLEAEVRSLADKKNYNALKTVGYRELYDYIEGHCDLATAVSLIKQHTRNYAKRQLTWFRNKDKFIEFEPEEKDKIIAYIEETMQHG